VYLRKRRSAQRGPALGQNGAAKGHALVELVAKIINGLHDAILIFGGIAAVAFALWVLTQLLGMV